MPISLLLPNNPDNFDEDDDEVDDAAAVLASAVFMGAVPVISKAKTVNANKGKYDVLKVGRLRPCSSWPGRSDREGNSVLMSSWLPL